MSFRLRPLSLMPLALLLLLGLSACDRDVPSPWKKMYFPLDNSTILPGAGPKRLTVKYKLSGPVEKYLHEYKRALERAGYHYIENGKNHDPAANTHAIIMSRGGEQVRVTIQGGARMQVEVKVLED